MGVWQFNKMHVNQVWQPRTSMSMDHGKPLTAVSFMYGSL
jgi:hypothetical protein